MSRFTKDVLLGINIAVKGASKKYPFIVGWELSPTAEQYTFTTYINLLINQEKLGEFYGKKLRNRVYSNESGSLTSFFVVPNPWDEKDEWQKEFDYFFEKGREIQKYITKYYSSVPDEYSLFNDTNQTLRPDISIDQFVIVEKNPE